MEGVRRRLISESSAAVVGQTRDRLRQGRVADCGTMPDGTGVMKE
jgi:hypothetical protein